MYERVGDTVHGVLKQSDRGAQPYHVGGIGKAAQALKQGRRAVARRTHNHHLPGKVLANFNRCETETEVGPQFSRREYGAGTGDAFVIRGVGSK
jgi:hypothetical protein